MDEVTQEDLDRYQMEGVEWMLCARVCRILRLKWQVFGEDTIDMKRMVAHYNTDEDTLRRIIGWYESHLISFKFKIL